MFAVWGRFVARHKKAVLASSVVLLVLSGILLTRGGQLVTYEIPGDTESGAAVQLIERQIPGAADASAVLVLSHPTLDWQSADFLAAVERSIAPLRADERISSVITPYSVPPASARSLVSEDGHRVLALISMRDDLVTATEQWEELRGKVPPTILTVHATDSVPIYGEINAVLADDLVRAEIISLPLTLILLLVVFGGVVAALLPLGVGILSVLGGTAAVMLASNFVDVSVYALNIVSLIGLGVAIDYSLFMVARFREELTRGDSVDEAIARTVATAGRAIAFSGLTVAVGLLGLAFYYGLYFSTLGFAGATVVALAVFYGLTFLTALLAVIGRRIDRLALPWRRSARPPEHGFWARLARLVMRRPVAFLVPTVLLLLLAGAPFLNIQLASVGPEALPERAESRVGYEILREEFPAAGATEILVVAEFDGAPLTRDRVGALYDASQRARALPDVLDVRSIVDLDPSMSRSDYQDLLTAPQDQWPPALREAARTSVGESIVTLRVLTESRIDSQEARDLVGALRDMPEPDGATLRVAGATATDMDMIDIIVARTPWALLFVVTATYLLLLLQTGSIILPLKALIMNLLSITASFGALVWIFQEGHLSELLRFTPTPIDPGTPVLLFCTVFGLSMDYEVLLLSRMHEEYEATGDNTQAVAGGLAKSGRLITSAAGIMVLVFGAFATAEVTVIKSVGLGLALAVLIDATLVRALVVPSAMRLMGKWNWWAPAWVTRMWKTFG